MLQRRPWHGGDGHNRWRAQQRSRRSWHRAWGDLACHTDLPADLPTGKFFPEPDVADDSQIADAINWVWNYASSDVISNSWGGGFVNEQISQAISNALTVGRGGRGSVVVFSTGNNSNRGLMYCAPTGYPSTLSSTMAVIAVGAINRNGEATDYPPCTGQIDVVAPSGHNTDLCVGEVVTFDRIGSAGCNAGPNGEQDFTARFSGTSAAAPQVSAVAALLLAREPNLSATAARLRIRSGADPWGVETFNGGTYNTFGYGKLDAYQTLTTGATISGRTQVRPYSACTWYVSTNMGAPPHSYQWWVNGTPVPGATSNSFLYSAGSSSFTLMATVTNALGLTVSDDQPVTVTSSTYPC